MPSLRSIPPVPAKPGHPPILVSGNATVSVSPEQARANLTAALQWRKARRLT